MEKNKVILQKFNERLKSILEEQAKLLQKLQSKANKQDTNNRTSAEIPSTSDS